MLILEPVGLGDQNIPQKIFRVLVNYLQPLFHTHYLLRILSAAEGRRPATAKPSTVCPRYVRGKDC